MNYTDENNLLITAERINEDTITPWTEYSQWGWQMFNNLSHAHMTNYWFESDRHDDYHGYKNFHQRYSTRFPLDYPYPRESSARSPLFGETDTVSQPHGEHEYDLMTLDFPHYTYSRMETSRHLYNVRQRTR